ncbi:hypothetical protein BJF92_11535 [Rhizobium rhizosphaerae]|uniref:Uncharacterized protein n=1 Tax=Xaviernesmea rhizosphaerae TaxID=1672749 RepID=A0A1Q9AMT6_9HYPH|nr:hypothetical protein BJF92_11535 [Xaviernesmea rhizosphaerae]
MMRALSDLRDLEARLESVGARARQDAEACGSSVFYAGQNRDGAIMEMTAQGERKSFTVSQGVEHHAAE